MSKEFNLIVCGDSGVGKSAFIQRHATGDFKRVHIPTPAAESTALTFKTSAGKVVVNCWEIPGNPVAAAESKLPRIDAVLIMFDKCNEHTFENVMSYLSAITEKFETKRSGVGSGATQKDIQVPKLLCGNKAEFKPNSGRVKDSQVSKLIQLQKLEYYDISAKSNYNFEKPFVWLLRQLVAEDLVFTA